MAHLVIRPLPLVKTNIVKGRITYMVNVSEPLVVYTYIWYIAGLKQHILVDAGAPAESFVKRGFVAENIASPVEALKRVGISPDEVNVVICTHLHFDHIEFGHMYKKARFIVQRAELETAFNPHPIQAVAYAPKEVLSGLNFQVVDGDTQVDDGVRVLLTPGHTEGGQSVAVDTEKGKVIISGLCTIRDNFEPPESVRRVMPVITPGLHLDAREAFASLKRIKQEADIIIPIHDAEFASQAVIP
jgi:N-acyl homoserine lactone hydrolase